MDNSEKVSQEYRHASPVGPFRDSIGKLGCDLLELAELQAKLFQADAKSAMEQSMGAMIFALIGCLSLLGCMPVLILGSAAAFAYFFEVQLWISQLTVGVVLSLISVAVIAVSMKKLSRSGAHFKRSAVEFSKNIEWAKGVFGSDSTK